MINTPDGETPVKRKRRNPNGDSGNSAVVSEVISCAYVGYFPLSCLLCHLRGGRPRE